MYPLKLKFESTFRKHTRLYALLALIATAFSWVPIHTNIAQATVPKYINFQGKLTKVSDGTNVTNGSYAFEFKLYDASTSGTLLWTETYDQPSGACTKLVVTSGVFNAKLGSCASLSGIDFTGGSIYLSVNFAPTGTSYDGEMSPRKQLVASPFALVANSVSGDGPVNTVNSSTTALTVAKSGSNYGLQVDTSAASAATGLKITSAAAASGIALSAISSGTNESITLDAKGTGSVSLGATSTGDVLLGGGSGATGCTVTNSTGAFACTAGGSFTTLGLTGAVTGAASYNGLVITANTGVITTGTWNATAIGSQYGGTGQNFSASSGVPSINAGTWSANAITQNGVAYGGASNAMSFTAQGAANTVLVANAGAPSFSAAITVGTSVTSPTINATTAVQTGGTQRLDSAGALSNITGYSQSSGNFSQSGTGTFGTGTGQVSLNGNTVIASGKTLDVSPTGGGKVTITNTTASNSAGALDLQVTSSSNFVPALNIAMTQTATGSVTSYGLSNNLASSAVVTGASVGQTLYGLYNSVSKTGADTATGTTNTYGTYNLVTNTGRTNVGTVNSYGGYFDAAGDTAGTSTVYGIYATAAGGDSNYAGVFANGNVGVGDTTPTALFTVGNGDLFQVNSSGAITAAAGITSSGTINFSTLSASSAVYTDGSKNLTSTAPTSGAIGYWSRSGATLSTTTGGDAVTTSGNISTSGSGTITSAGTLTASNGLTLTTGALNLTSTSGSTAITGYGTTSITSTTTTGNINTLANSSLTPAASATAYLLNLTLTNGSTNTTGTSTVAGINIAPTTTAAGVGGTMETYGIRIQNAAGTAGAGTQNIYGIRIGNQGAGTNTETTYGLYIDAQTGGGTASYGAIFMGGNIGIGTATPDRPVHIYSASSGGAVIKVEEPNPRFDWLESDAAANNKLWRMQAQAEQWKISAISDDLITTTDIITVDRTGASTIDQLQITNGNLAVGQVTASAKLHVLSTTEQLRLGYDTSNYIAYTVSSAGALTQALKANTANALRLTDSTNAYQTIDTRTTNSTSSAHTFSTTTPTITAASGSQYILSTFTPGTYKFAGATSITSTGTASNIGVLINQPTLDQNTASTSLTISEASNLLVNGPVKAADSAGGGTTTITNSYGVNIPSVAVNATGGAVTNAYGLSVSPPTGATNNYAAVFSGGNVGIGTVTPTAFLHIGSNGTASNPGLRLSGSWFTGGDSTTTKPQALVEASGATSTGWSTSGTGLGINAPSAFAGRLIDAKVNGTSSFSLNEVGGISILGQGVTNIGSAQAYWYQPSGATVSIGNNGDTGASNLLLRAGASGSSGGKITFNVDNTDRGAWSATGLGIGTTSPSTRLHVAGIATDTSGTLATISYPVSATLAGSLTGENIDLASNITATNQGTYGLQITNPGATNTGASNYIHRGIYAAMGSNLTQSSGGGTSRYYAFDASLPAITQTSGTVSAAALNIATNSITTGGTMQGINISAAGVGAGTLTGVNISAITAGAGTENAITIGSGWDNQISGNGWSVNGSGALTVASCSGCGSGARLDQITAATTTATIANANNAIVWNWGTLTTQTGMVFGGGTAMTTGSVLALGSGTYNHASGETGSLASITVADSTTTAGAVTSTTNGLNIASSIAATTSTSGTKTVNAINIASPTLTSCSGGASCVWNGVQITAPATTGSFTSTALKVVANSLTTDTAVSISGTGLTTGYLETKTLGSALTTGGAITVTGASYNPGAGNTGKLINLAFTNAANSTSGTATVAGISISPTTTAAGASGTHETYSIYIQPAAGTAGAGTQNIYGMRIGNQGAGTNTETTYGLYVDAQTGGATASYAAVFAGGNVGIGTTTPAARLTVAGTSGNIIRMQNTSGSNNLSSLDYWGSSSQMWGITLDKNAANNNLLYFYDNNDGTTPLILDGVANSSTANIDITATATTGTAARITASSLTSGTALSITPGSSMTTGAVLNLGSASYVHTGAETGSGVTYNITDASSNSSGSAITNGMLLQATFNTTASAGSKNLSALKINSFFTACGTTGGSCEYNGISQTTQTYTQSTTNAFNIIANYVNGGSLTQNTAAGSMAWYGAWYNTPNLTQTTGALSADGMKVVTGSITTGGTVQGVNIQAGNGAGAGTLNGINISNITAGAGTETAIKIGTGWDTGVSIAGTTGQTTQAAINVSGYSYLHAGTEAGSIMSLAYTDASSNSSGTATTNGILLSPTINTTASAGTKVLNGVSISPTLTACGTTAGTCTFNGYDVTTPALTQSTTNTYNMRGLNLGTAGALVQNTAAGAISWVGAAIQMPNITQTTGTVTSTGLAITGGTVTSGTAYALTTTASAGNVGIGKTTPSEKLNLSDGSNALLDSGYLTTPQGGFGRNENRILYSEEFDNASWTKTGTTVTANSVAGPEGYTTADTLNAGVSSTDNVKQSEWLSTATASTTWTGSVWLKKSSGSGTVNLRIDSGNQTGTAAAVTVTTSWQRFSVTQTFTGASTGTATFIINNGTTAYYAWGAQLELQSTLGSYNRTASRGHTGAANGLVINAHESAGGAESATSNAAIINFDGYNASGYTTGLLLNATDSQSYFPMYLRFMNRGYGKDATISGSNTNGLNFTTTASSDSLWTFGDTAGTILSISGNNSANGVKITTTDAKNSEALYIDTAESTKTQNIFTIESDVTSSNTTKFAVRADGAVGIGQGINGSTLKQDSGIQLQYSTTAGQKWGFVSAESGAYLNGNAYFDGAWKYFDGANGASMVNPTLGNIVFYTTATTGTSNAAINNWTEKMRIEGGGAVDIGTTSSKGLLTVAQTDAANDEGIYLDTEESTNTQTVFAIETDNGTADTVKFKVTADGEASAMLNGQGGNNLCQNGVFAGGVGKIGDCTSDRRLKTNIVDLDGGALEKIMQVRPRVFDWINGAGLHQSGFIAQEVQAVIPELYRGETADGYLRFSKDLLVPYLTKALQELNQVSIKTNTDGTINRDSFVFEMPENQANTAQITGTGTQAVASTGFVINQKGSGNIIQLQQAGIDKLLIANDGSLHISTNLASGFVMEVKNADTALLTINTKGTAVLTGTLVVKKDIAVLGTVLGSTSVVAKNTSGSPIHKGDVVYLTGATDAVFGDQPTITVAAATENEKDKVIVGIADRNLSDFNLDESTPVSTDPTTTNPGEYLNVVITGTFKKAAATTSNANISTGDKLTLSATAGKLRKLNPNENMPVVGVALDTLSTNVGSVRILLLSSTTNTVIQNITTAPPAAPPVTDNPPTPPPTEDNTPPAPDPTLGDASPPAPLP